MARLYQLLPRRPNELWWTDVTYIRIPAYGWRYAITVIDYYSRYLLALHLAPSDAAIEASHALRLAVAEAERIHGPLRRPLFLVTDNGPSFIARRFQQTLGGMEIAGSGLSAFSQVGIRYRRPVQLGLLERFHETRKYEQFYWPPLFWPSTYRPKPSVVLAARDRYRNAPCASAGASAPTIQCAGRRPRERPSRAIYSTESDLVPRDRGANAAL